MQKRPILLMELVISLVLFGAIIGILFSSYREFSLAKIALRKEKELILTRQKLQLRLGQIFSHLKTLKMKDSSCHIAYNNEIDMSKDFRGVLEGMLYIDKGRLAFVTWAEKAPARKEILVESASSFSFSFFDEKKGAWTSQYPDQKPLMLKITIDQTTYPFFL